MKQFLACLILLMSCMMASVVTVAQVQQPPGSIYLSVNAQSVSFDDAVVIINNYSAGTICQAPMIAELYQERGGYPLMYESSGRLSTFYISPPLNQSWYDPSLPDVYYRFTGYTNSCYSMLH